jgi:hypothetical protein
MKNVNYFKKLNLLRQYRLIVKRNRERIIDKSNRLNLRIDNIGRIYTVYNCPEDVKSYGGSLAEKYIRDYINRVETFFIEIGLTEYIGIRDIENLNGLDYLIVFDFKGIDSKKFFNNLIRYSSTILILGLISFFLIF